MSEPPDTSDAAGRLAALEEGVRRHIETRTAQINKLRELRALSSSLRESVSQTLERTHASTAIRIGELLSVQLRISLQATMRRSNHKMITTRLFEEYGPLGNIRSRIDLAYALEIIDTKTYRDLVLINKIRVKFAHSISERKFSDEDIADLLYQLSPAGKKDVIPSTYINKALDIIASLGRRFDADVKKLKSKSLDS